MCSVDISLFMLSTANPTWDDTLERCFKAHSSKLERLFLFQRGQRDVRALYLEPSKMSPQVAPGLAVCASCHCEVYLFGGLR